MTHWQTIRMVLLMLWLSISSVAVYVFYQQELYFCMFFAGVLVLAIIVYVILAYSQNTHRLLRMVESIRYGDFSLSFTPKRQNRKERQLLEDINGIMTHLRTRTSAQEERCRYFETLLDTVDTCMLVVDKEGQVLWMNRAGVQDLCGHTIHQLEELKGLNADFPLKK